MFINQYPMEKVCNIRVCRVNRRGYISKMGSSINFIIQHGEGGIRKMTQYGGGSEKAINGMT